MAAKPTPPPRRGGPTQRETDRVAEQVKLRLAPDVREDLDALALRWRVTRSEAVARMVERAMVDDEMRGTVRGASD